MRSNRKLSLSIRSAVAGIACLTLAGSAFGGTLYHWTTEEGTYAYTDDKKRIPRRYRNEAKQSTMKRLKNYDRYTPVPQAAESTYGERVQARLDGLREATRPQIVAVPGAAPGAPGGYLTMGGGRFGGGGAVTLPIPGADIREPLTVESIRVRKSDGYQSTRHVRVVKRGDEVISVFKNERNDGPVTPRHRESDFE